MGVSATPTSIGQRRYIPTDLNHNSDFVVRSHPAVLDGFVSFYRKAVQALNLFGAEHCVGDRAEQDYTGMPMTALAVRLTPLAARCAAPALATGR